MEKAEGTREKRVKLMNYSDFQTDARMGKYGREGRRKKNCNQRGKRIARVFLLLKLANIAEGNW